jgi:hypothetical protein
VLVHEALLPREQPVLVPLGRPVDLLRLVVALVERAQAVVREQAEPDPGEQAAAGPLEHARDPLAGERGSHEPLRSGRHAQSRYELAWSRKSSA